MRAIIEKDVGIISWFATLDPSAKDILVNIFVVDRDNAVEVSLCIRLRDKAPKQEGGPLKADEANDLARDFAELDEEVVRNCMARAGGNPLFLEQLFRNADELDSGEIPGPACLN